jgi:Domain of unknown function (DUF4359)
MKLKLGAATFLLVAGVMALSNPNQSKYIDYASTKFVREIPKTVCEVDRAKQELEDDFSQSLLNLCNSGLGWALTANQESIRATIDRNTQRHNYLLLSIYTTEVPDYSFKTIGAIGNFFIVGK